MIKLKAYLIGLAVTLLLALAPPAHATPHGPALVPTTKVQGVSDREFQCMAENIYREARDQPVNGMVAVAKVVLNRTESGDHPDHICGVVKEHRVVDGVKRCQFSWVCERRGHYGREDDAWLMSQAIAKAVLENRTLPDITGGAIFYAKCSVSPDRIQKGLVFHVRIGEHCFYREPKENEQPGGYTASAEIDSIFALVSTVSQPEKPDDLRLVVVRNVNDIRRKAHERLLGDETPEQIEPVKFKTPGEVWRSAETDVHLWGNLYVARTPLVSCVLITLIFLVMAGLSAMVVHVRNRRTEHAGSVAGHGDDGLSQP
jgi:hypothetical protein